MILIHFIYSGSVRNILKILPEHFGALGGKREFFYKKGKISMRNFRKLMAMAVGATLSLTMLAGCNENTGSAANNNGNSSAGNVTSNGDDGASSTSDSSAEGGSVYWLNFKPESDGTLQEIAKMYTDKTGVSVNVVTAASGTYESSLTAEMDKSAKPTLFVINSQQAATKWGDYALDLTDTPIANELNTTEYNFYVPDNKLVAIPYKGDEIMDNTNTSAATGAVKKKKHKDSYKSSMRRWSWLFLGPVLIAFAIGFVWSFFQGIYLSFCKFRVVSDAELIGFGNYTRAFKDPTFLHAFWYTALFAVVSLVIINVLAFLVALALTKGIKGSNLYRTVFFMPNLIGGIVLGYIWSMIFDGILSKFNTSILLESKYGFWGLIILMCWQQIGYMMIIYIAGLQTVPEDMLEAARIDGANSAQILFRITIPNVMPSITICMFLSLTNGFKLFDQNLALTNGQPINILPGGVSVKTTEMLALNIYNTFYGSNVTSQGVAQAKAVILFILVAGLGLAQLAFTRKKEVQQ